MGGGKTTCPDKDLMTSSDMKFTNQNERGRERERERDTIFFVRITRFKFG